MKGGKAYVGLVHTGERKLEESAVFFTQSDTDFFRKRLFGSRPVPYRCSPTPMSVSEPLSRLLGKSRQKGDFCSFETQRIWPVNTELE